MKKPTARELADRLNQKLKDEGRFWDKPKDDKTQIIFFRDNPKPKKLCGLVQEDIDYFDGDIPFTCPRVDKNSKSWHVGQILSVGQKGVCTSKDLSFFLPDFPTPHGSEPYFYVSEKDVSDALIPDLIRGCHLIEMKYRKDTGFENGFGSPSPTYRLINVLKGIDRKNADELTRWVAANGGNCYISPNKNK